MTPRRLPLATWCLAGLLFTTGLALALLVTLPVAGGFFDKYDKDLAPRPKQFGGRSKSPPPQATGDRRCQILGHPCKLYRNLGNGRFEDVTATVLQLNGPWFYSHGCAVADYDCD